MNGETIVGPAGDGTLGSPARTAAVTSLRLTSRLPVSVIHAVEQRIALLDELDTVRDQREELARAVHVLGGHDNGVRPTAESGDPRHRLEGALRSVERHQRQLEELKRAVNGAVR